MSVVRTLTRLLILVTALTSLLGAIDKVSTEEFVSRQLDSIGKADARSAGVLRVADGRVTYDVLSGGAGHLSGGSKLASMGKQFNFLLFFNAADYTGEQFKFDGQKELIAANTVDLRSHIASFVYKYPAILREGLWGGTWNGGWPLQDLQGRNAELKFEGTKKVDGKELLEYRYQPKHLERELSIHLLFEPDTYRHVKTIYEEYGPTGGLTALSISEAFGDFKEEHGLTLPHSYTIRYEPQQLHASTMIWKVNWQAVQVGVPAPPAKPAPAPKK